MTSIEKADVVVIGAGIVGSSTAFHLINSGVKTTLIERKQPAMGPSGDSSAICHLFYIEPELSMLAKRGCELLKNIPELTGYPNVFHEVGMLWATGEKAAHEWAEATRRIRDDEGGDIETLAPEEFADIAPRFDPEGIALGVWEPTVGYADPFEATNAFAKAAKDKGVKLKSSTEVTEFIVEGGKIIGVGTSQGDRIAADIVVAATGPWTKKLFQQLGIELPLHVERHSMAVLDAPGEARAYMPFGWYDDILNNYARPEGDNNVLIGTWSGGGTGYRNPDADRPNEIENPDEYDTTVDHDESIFILQHIIPREPELENLGIRPGYASLYDMSPDDYPVIDEIPGIKGLYVAAGSSGHGFKTGPAVGEEIVNLITNGHSEILKPYGLSRFQKK
jgi:sarcosine oxidase subunit beta